MRLHWSALGVAADALLIYALAGFFLVPHLVRSQLQRYVAETLHRKVTVGDIRFNPFTFEASAGRFGVQGLKMATPDPYLYEALPERVFITAERVEGTAADGAVRMDNEARMSQAAGRDRDASRLLPGPANVQDCRRSDPHDCRRCRGSQ